MTRDDLSEGPKGRGLIMPHAMREATLQNRSKEARDQRKSEPVFEGIDRERPPQITAEKPWQWSRVWALIRGCAELIVSFRSH
jgi:hypothetical protein